MDDIRRHKLESLLISELSSLISTEVRDPRVKPITLTTVEVTHDGSNAKILFTLFGVDHHRDPETEATMKDCIVGLNAAAGFLKSQLKKRIRIKHIPTLQFKPDEGFENTIRVAQILKRL